MTAAPDHEGAFGAAPGYRHEQGDAVGQVGSRGERDHDSRDPFALSVPVRKLS